MPAQYFILYKKRCQDQLIDRALSTTSHKYRSGGAWHWILLIEQYLYAFVYVLYDFLSMFNIISYLFMGTLHITALPQETIFFGLSVIYACCVHYMCRMPDLEQQYSALQQIMAQKPLEITKSALIYALIPLCPIVGFLTLSATAAFSPALAIALLFATGYFCYKHATQITVGSYSSWLQLSLFSSLQHFSRIINRQLQTFGVSTITPLLAFISNAVFLCVAVGYGAIYISSAVRKQIILNDLPSPPPSTASLHDPIASKANP